MFSFDPIADIDLDYFEYQLRQDSTSGTLINSVLSTDGTTQISGTNKANVFTVSVANSTSSTTTSYFGRVRTVSTSGARSAWSGYDGSGDTPLIASQYIQSLTADKITAGTIGAHTISLAGVTSVIKSSTYNGTYDPSTGKWLTGTAGWLIAGNGQAIFDATQIRGSVAAGSINLDTHNYWLPSTVGPPSTPTTFKVGDANKFMEWNGTNLIVNGSTIAGINTTNTKIFIGAGNYANTDTAFYVDSSGNFSLKNKLYWNGSTLSIDGTVSIGGTAASTVRDGAASGATAVQSGSVKDHIGGTNVTTITGGKISTGTISSVGGTRTINLDTGAINFGQFTVDTAGNAVFGGSLSSASGSVGANFTIGSNLTIGNNVRINGAAGDGGVSVLKIRADSQPLPTPSPVGTAGRQPLSVVSFLDNVAFRVVYTGDCRYGASMQLESDIRLKKDINKENLGLDFIKLLNPVSFNWDKPEFSNERKYRGFIAQEVLEVSEKFNNHFEGVFLEDDNDPESFLGLDYPQFISPIVKAIQELSAKVDELESRLV